MVQLRPATLDDVPTLRYWDSQPHVIAASGEDDAADWELEIRDADEWTEILVAELDGRPIGVLQIIDPARERTHYWGDADPDQRAIDIWIGEESDLGHGHGTAMMTLALERCFADPAVTGVLIDPLVGNVAAHRFYRRLGFEPLGERTFGADRCLVHRVDRAAWNRGAEPRR